MGLTKFHCPVFLPNAVCPSVPECRVLLKKKKQSRQCHCRNRGIKFFFFSNCDNGIAKNGKKKWFRNLQKSKKQVSCPQYFHNKSHIISYYQLKKIVTTNCGNVIAEIGKKNLWQYHCRNREKNKSDKLLEAIALPKQGE